MSTEGGTVVAERFTREEATETVAGDVRAIILWEIASRCGQVPDVHALLLDGIEAAARRIAAECVFSPEVTR